MITGGDISAKHGADVGSVGAARGDEQCGSSTTGGGSAVAQGHEFDAAILPLHQGHPGGGMHLGAVRGGGLVRLRGG